MNPQITFLRNEIAGVNAQLAADNGKSTILSLINEAKLLLDVREKLGEPVNRAKAEALATQIESAVTAYNASNQITMRAVADIMADFDAAVASDPDAPNTPA